MALPDVPKKKRAKVRTLRRCTRCHVFLGVLGRGVPAHNGRQRTDTLPHPVLNPLVVIERRAFCDSVQNHIASRVLEGGLVDGESGKVDRCHLLLGKEVQSVTVRATDAVAGKAKGRLSCN